MQSNESAATQSIRADGAVPAPPADAPPAAERGPVNIRENTGAGSDASPPNRTRTVHDD